MNDEMRTEMIYVRFPDDTEEYVQCDKAEAEGTGIIFTAYHPTEVTKTLNADGEPFGEDRPQEYGIMVITTEVHDAISDLDEFVINQAVVSLKEAGCLVDEDEIVTQCVGCGCDRDD